MKPARIDIWHNILWSQYKAEVFSCIYAQADPKEFDFHFFQFAETEGNRTNLSGVDISRHRYPFELIFKGSLDSVSLFQKLKGIISRTLRTTADLSLLTGYEKLEIWLQIALIKLGGKKVAIFCDSTINDQPQRFLRGLVKTIIFKSVDGIFSYGERSRDYVLHYGANPSKVFHRCQAAALPQDYTPELAIAARIQNAPQIDEPKYLYVGRLSAEKGLCTLLEAFSSIYAQNPKAKLILVGSGQLREDLENKARVLNIVDAVTFTGGKSGKELFNEYSRATAVVLPSTSEPWGLVVNEALSYGCPAIVSSACGCIPELIKHRETGLVFRTGNVQDLVIAMTEAPSCFADIERVTGACFEIMVKYTPNKAAEEIILGCRKILAFERNHNP